MAILKNGRNFTLKIKDKEYPLRISFRSLDYLDQVYTLEDKESGIKFGFGLNLLVMGLQIKNITAIINLLKAATLHLAQKPSEDEIIEMIDGLNDKEYFALFDGLDDFLSNAALTKHAYRQIKKAAAAETKKIEEKKN